jgi:hypothetical protein
VVELARELGRPAARRVTIVVSDLAPATSAQDTLPGL